MQYNDLILFAFGFGGVMYVAFKGYMNIIQAIDNTARDNTILRNDMGKLKEDINRHEATINYLMTKNK